MKTSLKICIVLLLTLVVLGCEVPIPTSPAEDNNKENNENIENNKEGNGNTNEKTNEDLSYLYLISQSSYTITYNADGSSSLSSTTKQEYIYDGYKKIGYNLYVDDSLLSSLTYTYNGLTCTEEGNGTIVEYLDDTYLRVKKQATPTTLSVTEYDGKKIVNQKTYQNNNLMYECRYDYNGLIATVYSRDYDYETNKLLDWRKSAQITFLDNTYLRTKEHIGFSNNFTTIYHNTYEGTKLLNAELWIDFGEYKVLSIKTEYTYSNLQSIGTHLSFDTTNPQNTNPISKTITMQTYLE